VIGEYTVAAVAAPLAVVALELVVLRTGLFREARYWATLAIALAFQVPVDGWLTRIERPIVQYSADATSGVRFPWHIPVEDFGFGFALVTATLLLWRWQGPEPRAGARRGRLGQRIAARAEAHDV
jgi:lycopene cyclase domain-containing protein